MKKTNENADPQRITTSELSAAKRPVRQSKKTVLMIASMDSGNEHSDVVFPPTDSLQNLPSNSLPDAKIQRTAASTKSISPELATVFSCKLMAVALQLRSWQRSQNEYQSILDEMEELLDSFDDEAGLTPFSGDAPQRLNRMLSQMYQKEIRVRERNNAANNDQASELLSNALHSVIGSVSQRIQFDEAVAQTSQRQIYEFAYGLTHEINNPLANIAARAQQMISAASSESDRRSLATIVDQTMRAHEMLAEMMRVVQPRTVQPRIEDLVAILRQAAAIHEKQWNLAQIQCVLRLPATPLYGLVEKESLIDSISSLLQNSLQVCRPNDRVEILCEEVHPGQTNYGPTNGPSQGTQNGEIELPPRVRVAVRDTGPGLSLAAAERAWDLYFSGREHGRGLGISLAKVRQTIDAHRGLVWLESSPNAGCAVEIRLPKSPEPPIQRKAFSI
ncbi:MAG: HAMP domain-containing sensor histidine kinase [Planctomycetota bacterium]|nr:HAMP domain-containing sensor histidine kinase [Planctomycetota bacterium]